MNDHTRLDQKTQLIQLDSCIFLPNVEPNVKNAIINANTFDNPIFHQNEKHGISNWNTPRYLKTYKIKSDGIELPRGFLMELFKILTELKIPHTIINNMTHSIYKYPPIKNIKLRDYQQKAVEATEASQGVIISPTGSGKTLIGLEIIRQKKERALIIVHRADLATQWIQEIKKHFGLQAGTIGMGQWDIKDITVAMIQTLSSRKDEIKELNFGLVLFDEVHHVPASQSFEIMNLLPCFYRYGLSATPNRRDKLEPIIYRSIGDKLIEINKSEVEAIGSTVPAFVYVIKTNFNPGLVNSWQNYISAIIESSERNSLILECVPRDKPTLILTDRIAHADLLSDMLHNRGIPHTLAHGKLKKKIKDDAMEQMKKSQITVGTTSLLGEGLDVSAWEVLIMATPICSPIKLLQAIGRVVRSSKGKKEAQVIDLHDDCAFSGSSLKKRLDIYRNKKIPYGFKKNES